RSTGARRQHRLVLWIYAAIQRSRGALAALPSSRSCRARRAVERFRGAGARIGRRDQALLRGGLCRRLSADREMPGHRGRSSSVLQVGCSRARGGGWARLKLSQIPRRPGGGAGGHLAIASCPQRPPHHRRNRAAVAATAIAQTEAASARGAAAARAANKSLA